LRKQKEITGRGQGDVDAVDDIENYYKLLSDDDKELFWTLNIDASSTLKDLREQMAEARKQAVLDTALERFDIGQSLLSALSSDNKDWDKIKEQFEELGVSTWHAFAAMSQQEQIELINETNLKNA
jgi:hypothetical protein